jgi:hypothetical protein
LERLFAKKLVNAFNVRHPVHGEKEGYQNCDGEITFIFRFAVIGLKKDFDNAIVVN